MSGSLCRCGAYLGIREAVRDAAEVAMKNLRRCGDTTAARERGARSRQRRSLPSSVSTAAVIIKECPIQNNFSFPCART
jgi:hypothetical protein